MTIALAHASPSGLGAPLPTLTGYPWRNPEDHLRAEASTLQLCHLRSLPVASSGLKNDNGGTLERDSPD